MASPLADLFVNHNLTPVVGHWLPGLLCVALGFFCLFVSWLSFFSVRSVLVVCNGTAMFWQPSVLT